MLSYEIYAKFKNTYFKEQIRTTASSSSSFKLDLVDLTVFSDLNLRLTKFKPFTTLCIFHVPAVTLFLSYVIKFENDGTFFFQTFSKN